MAGCERFISFVTQGGQQAYLPLTQKKRQHGRTIAHADMKHHVGELFFKGSGYERFAQQGGQDYRAHISTYMST